LRPRLAKGSARNVVVVMTVRGANVAERHLDGPRVEVEAVTHPLGPRVTWSPDRLS
jgi:hypothetical protein